MKMTLVDRQNGKAIYEGQDGKFYNEEGEEMVYDPKDFTQDSESGGDASVQE